MNAYLITRAAVRFVVGFMALVAIYVLLHILATLPLLVFGL
jgi:hypothetical protein